MNTTSLRLLWIAPLLVACGGGTKQTAPVTPVDEVVEEKPAVAEAPPAPPPPEPQVWRAKAALTPVKGAKLKPTVVAFSQREDQDAQVTADSFTGAKPGTYWLVVHESEECGPNGTKAGAVWGPSAGAAMKVVIAKDLTGGLESGTAEVTLDGDSTIVGHVLVLHEDKKGKPGKTLACGAIERAIDEDE